MSTCFASGVPQGPLLYINDSPDCLAQAKIFADDTKLYVAHSSDSVSPLSLALSNFCTWSQKAGNLILLFRNAV